MHGLVAKAVLCLGHMKIKSIPGSAAREEKDGQRHAFHRATLCRQGMMSTDLPSAPWHRRDTESPTYHHTAEQGRSKTDRDQWTTSLENWPSRLKHLGDWALYLAWRASPSGRNTSETALRAIPPLWGDTGVGVMPSYCDLSPFAVMRADELSLRLTCCSIQKTGPCTSPG